MNTEIAKNFSTQVNFFHQLKINDWRYQAWESLVSKEDGQTETVIYWIGVLDLTTFEEDKTMYPLGSNFFKSEVQDDMYQRRDVDGDPQGLCTTLYDFSAIMWQLMIAKNHHGNSCHFLLEEKVDRYGKHAVNILYEEGKNYGWTKTRPWYYDPVKDWLCFHSYIITEKTKRLCILYNKRYNWLK